MPAETCLAELYQHVLDTLAPVPPAKRARLLRALAEITPDQADSAQLRILAVRCEELDRDCSQLTLNFGRRAA